MIQSKNLKLKLGLCGLALTSFLALNTHNNTVHADTVNGSNADVITWDSDQDDSQVVQSSVQKQNAPVTQSVQSNVQSKKQQIAVSSVSSTPVQAKRAEMGLVRQSNAQTSTVNRLNANSVCNNQVKVVTVHDTAQMPVQKTKVAQFNQGSKIYSLNNSSTLSKNNGDGYVITNAGKYNGRAVDIGVTINNVSEQQGNYTTKWSNGDYADVTGKTDASFKYENSVLAGTQQNNVAVPNKTRNRTQKMTTTQQLHGFYMGIETMDGSFYTNTTPNGVKSWLNYVDPGTLARALAAQNIKATDTNAVREMAGRLLNMSATDDTNGFSLAVKNGGYYIYDNSSEYAQGGIYAAGSVHDTFRIFTGTMDDKGHIGVDVANQAGAYVPVLITDSKGPANAKFTMFHFSDPTKYTWDQIVARDPDLEPYKNDFNKDNLYTYHITSDEPVTDQLQLDKTTPASLNYNYTVGLYDAQTGDLITDLKPEYKGKTGATATASSSVMNNAIKNKIQQINQNKAAVSYTGTSANDDVAFYQETRKVNPQSTDVNRKAQRVIHVTFPNGVKPASYDGIVDQNNDIVQTVTFTRTGTENVVSGQKTYGPWQQHGGFSAVTLPSIPGYTMTTTGV